VQSPISARQREPGRILQGRRDQGYPKGLANPEAQVKKAAVKTLIIRMNRYYEIIIRSILSLALFIVPVKILSQTNKIIPDIARDTTDSEVSKHTLISGLGYGTNFIYLGSTISGNQPYEYASLIYGFKSELYASVSAVHLSSISPFLAFYSGTLSYSHVFNSWFDISASFSGYYVTTSLRDDLFNGFYYGDLTAGFDWQILYTKITGGILFSDEKNGYLQVRNSRYFQTPEFTTKKFYFSLDPYISVLLGTITKIETTEGNVIKVSPPYKKGGKYGQANPVNTISRSFGFMEADIGLPASFNSGKFTFEAEPGYILAGIKDPEYAGPKGFYFTMSAYFRIF
jgi:hypothetical protein